MEVFKFGSGQVRVYSGTMDDIPVVIIEHKETDGRMEGWKDVPEEDQNTPPADNATVLVFPTVESLRHFADMMGQLADEAERGVA